MKKVVMAISALVLFSAGLAAQTREMSLSHISFDVSREVFKALNEAFLPQYLKSSGIRLKVDQSHAGASKQARAVVDGLPADLLSFNQFVDIQYIYENTRAKPDGGVLAADWQKLLPNNSSPFSSTVAFVVRKGNPKKIKDWEDLVKPGVRLVLANPKTSATARYGFINAYAYGLKAGAGEPAKARDYWKSFIKAIPVLGTGGRDASTIFAERNVGDVLVTLEAEAYQILNSLKAGQYEVIVPTYLVDASIYVATSRQTARNPAAAAAARAYWDFLYSPAGQTIVARNFFRPIDKSVAAAFKDSLPQRTLVSIESLFGTWDRVHNLLFKDGALFDEIFKELRKN